MAERRMFAKTIIDSDAFLDMPQSSQLLYFHLSMRADDDGFLNNPKSIMRNVGCKDDDINLLIIKKFLIPFESGVVVIKHWKIHNYIRSDRYKETKYKEERDSLLLDENNAYTQSKNDLGIPNGYQMDTQDRIGKDSIGKVNKEKSKKESLFSLFVDDYNISETLKAKLTEWLTYKTERKESYKEQGLKALLRKVENNALEYGDKAICELIDECMANGWKGIIFDKLKKKEPEPIHSNSNASYDLDEFNNRSLYGELKYKKK